MHGGLANVAVWKIIVKEEVLIKKQLRTNIGLADTLKHSSFIYSIYVEGTGTCDSSKISFGNHVYS